MSLTGEFTKETVETLSKRAALHCSNPDCGVLTSAPTTKDNGSVNIGEAAHIYGRAERSKRFNPEMTITERADITNGIWLCRNCHKEIDTDEARFPAELLFEWRREHERVVMERHGLKSDLFRSKLKMDRLKPFEEVSYLAHQIAYDRPPHWEYKLTMEILRRGLEPIQSKWKDLQRGLYVHSATPVRSDDIMQWWSAKFEDSLKNADALRKIITEEVKEAWGAPGVPGNDLDILRVCKLIIGVAQNFLRWEEDICFSSIPEEFLEVQAAVQGACGKQLAEIIRLPQELSKIFENKNPDGVHKIQLVLELPDNFGQNFSIAMEASMSRHLAKLRSH